MNRHKKKGLLLLVVLSLITAFFLFDMHQYLNFAYIQAQLAGFEAWHQQHPVIVALVYFAAYIIITGLSLPGAVPMTLLGGALFGLFWGTVIISFASTIGATLAFLVARYLLRDVIQARFSKRIETIDRGIKKDGAFYLFTLRLVPIFPFFLINLGMGLTAMRVVTFYLVSQVGMLAGTIVYVNAGTQLAQLESLAGIMSPSLILSFALLGIFPLLAKKLVDMLQRRRAYKGWKKPVRFDRNMIVIGAGAGGLVSAYIAAAVKAKVTLIEGGKMGGDCLNTGCVPSKALIKTARVADMMRHADQYGLEPQSPGIDFKKVMQRVENIIKDIEPHDSVERYESLGVDVKQGYAKLIDPWTVVINYPDGTQETLTARSIVLATGAEPFVPPLPGLDETGYLTSDTLWERLSQRDRIPQQLVVLGGGPIGCELSQAFARLGSEVTQVEMGERLLAREDDDVAALAQQSQLDSGVNVLTGHQALRCERRDDKKVLIVSHKGSEIELPFDELLVAVGRKARTQGFGLDTLGIEAKQVITHNEFLQTRFPHIFVVGDAAGPYQFTHAAAHQAWYAAVNGLFGQFKRFAVDYRLIPWTTFVDPEIARIGINEQEAREQGIDYEVTRYSLDDLDRAITESSTAGFVKILTPPGKDKILGVTIVGDHAGELLAEFVLAMKYNLGLNKILGTIHSYPTWAEANKFTAGEWKKNHAPQRILDWLGRYHRSRLG